VSEYMTEIEEMKQRYDAERFDVLAVTPIARTLRDADALHDVALMYNKDTEELGTQLGLDAETIALAKD